MVKKKIIGKLKPQQKLLHIHNYRLNTRGEHIYTLYTKKSTLNPEYLQYRTEQSLKLQSL